MRIKVPTELNVMGKLVKIEYQDEINLDGEDLSGACLASANLILISLGEHDSEEELLLTLNHELIHYVLEKSGVSNLLDYEKEETIVVALEENLLPMLKWDKRKWRKKIEVEIGRKNQLQFTGRPVERGGR